MPIQFLLLFRGQPLAAAITLTLGSRLGNVETPDGGRQVFATVAKTDTSIAELIQRGLAEVGHTADTELTAFTDGCSGLRQRVARRKKRQRSPHSPLMIRRRGRSSGGRAFG